MILGKLGNSADIDKLLDLLDLPMIEFEKAELLCCFINLEKGKRNSLFGRLTKEGPILEMAVKYIKSQTTIKD